MRLPLETAGERKGPPERRALDLDGETAGAIRRLAARHDAGLPACLLAIWQSLLWRLVGHFELVVGCEVDGREIPELDDAIGPFARIVPWRSRLAGELELGRVVAAAVAARAEIDELQSYFQAPENRDGQVSLDGQDLVAYRYEQRPVGWRAGGVAFTLLEQGLELDQAKLALCVVEQGENLSLHLVYRPERFQGQAVDLLEQRLRTLLAALLAAPQARLAELDVVGEAERRWLVTELNDTGARLAPDCVPALIAAQADRSSLQPAVSFRDRRLTYGELGAQARAIAARLRSLGVGPETLVALYLPRSPELVAAILGVWWAGGAYLPLDSGQPRERLAFILEDGSPRVVLTTEDLQGDLPEAAGESRESVDERSQIVPANVAYVIYTSGSTGKPKGVAVTHGGLVNYLRWCCHAYEVERGWGTIVDSPIGFDLTVTALLSPLLVGGEVRLLPEGDAGPDLAAALLREGGCSLAKLTPAHLELLHLGGPDLDWPAAPQVLVIGGEALAAEALAPWRRRFPSTRIVNEYGPTETVVGCCIYEVSPALPRRGPVPIGRPIANTRLYVVGDHGRLVPAGVAGELWIGGAGVARCYLGAPGLTADRFVPDPWSSAPGKRLYRSGDLACHRADGDLEFVGRADQQLKIHGFRIEPGEVESALDIHPAVRRSVVVAHGEGIGERRLVAYVVAAGDSVPSVDVLRTFLAERLPDYMVPAVFVPLESLPLTANGKVDRAALPEPGSQRPNMKHAYVEPRSPTEKILAAICARVLGLDRVGVHDSFFGLGGDSMRSVQVIALGRERGLQFTVRDLYQHQTVAGLAQMLEPAVGAEAAAAQKEADLSGLLQEVEGLSEEEVRARLKAKLTDRGDMVAVGDQG
jgi:amino acid adenylation domain-containing protein